MDGLAKVLRVYKVQSPSSVFLVSRDTNIFLLSLVNLNFKVLLFQQTLFRNLDEIDS